MRDEMRETKREIIEMMRKNGSIYEGYKDDDGKDGGEG